MLNNDNILNKKEYIILLVDDDIDIINTNSKLLEMKGYNVISTPSGNQAIDIIKNQNIDLVILDYFMPEITGEQVVKEVRSFNKEVVILLQTGYAGERPPLKMLEELDIQGYHDKTEGIENLLLWIAACTRSCAQIREIKKLFEEITLAYQTIKSIKESQEKLIEQERLASLGEMLGSIAEHMANRMVCISNTQSILSKLTQNLSQAINQTDVNDDACKGMIHTITTQVEELKGFCDGMGRTLNSVGKQALEIKQESQEQKFTLDILLRSIRMTTEEELIRKGCTMKTDTNVDLLTEIEGKYSDLVYVITSIIRNSIDAYEGNKGQIELLIQEDNNNNIKFSIKDYGKGISDKVKKDIFKGIATTKGVEATGMGLYVANSIIKGRFGGRIWFESEEGEGTTFFVAVPKI